MEGVNLEHYYHSPDYYQYFHNYDDYMGQYYMHYLMNTENISEVSMSNRQGVTQDFETGGQNWGFMKLGVESQLPNFKE